MANTPPVLPVEAVVATRFPAINLTVDPDTSMAAGGQVIICTAAATLKIGDVVYLDSAKKVNKSTTGSLYGNAVGVVVGGSSFPDFASFFDSTLVGTTAALVDTQVYVQTSGVAWVTAHDATAIDDLLGPSGTTAGQVAVVTVVAGPLFGYAIDASVAGGDVIRMVLQIGRATGSSTPQLTSLAVGGTLDASSIATFTSTTKGLLLPRMTTTQRDAIGTPTAGLTIYNSTTNKINVRVAAAWEAVTSA